MLIRITSARCIGIDACPVTVEVNISNGIGIHLVGLADVAVKESLLRTVTALQSLEFRVPGKKIVINLAPADIHKKGSGYDVPIALGIIAASGQREMPGLGKYLILGELGLDGTVRDVPGALPISEAAPQWGFEGCILPLNSAMETVEFRTCKVFGVRDLNDVLRIVCEEDGYEELLVERQIPAHSACDSTAGDNGCTMDFGDIVGQDAAKRGLEIAAAGSHNVILIGSPGSGKSSLAKAMCGILPPLTKEEALQTCKIYSVAGRGDLRRDIWARPFRAPHNTASTTALVGGGSSSILPGEISLAHNGVLFLDEFCEIPRSSVEALRGPMEDRTIVVSRLRSRVEFPADFTLIAATNPCPCGYYGDGDRCTCSVGRREAYIARLSGPLSDRIDIQVWCRSVPPKLLIDKPLQESSKDVARRVAIARRIQMERFRDERIFCNGQMDNRMLDKYCPLDRECRDFLEKAMERMGMSARACKRIIRLSRTIADLEMAAEAVKATDDVLKKGKKGSGEGTETMAQCLGNLHIKDTGIKVGHLAEAISYRFLDKKG